MHSLSLVLTRECVELGSLLRRATMLSIGLHRLVCFVLRGPVSFNTIDAYREVMTHAMCPSAVGLGEGGQRHLLVQLALQARHSFFLRLPLVCGGQRHDGGPSLRQVVLAMHVLLVLAVGHREGKFHRLVLAREGGHGLEHALILRALRLFVLFANYRLDQFAVHAG